MIGKLVIEIDTKNWDDFNEQDYTPEEVKQKIVEVFIDNLNDYDYQKDLRRNIDDHIQFDDSEKQNTLLEIYKIVMGLDLESGVRQKLSDWFEFVLH